MKNLITRTWAGALFVVVIVGSIFWHPIALLFVFFVFQILALWEYARLFSKKNYKIHYISLLSLGSLLYLLIGLIANSFLNEKYIFASIPLIFLLLAFALFSSKKHILEHLAIKLLGLIYISIPFALFNIVRNLEIHNQSNNGQSLLIIFFILIWANDTFAYLFGTAFGKTPLFKSISPKKTWEGSIGGAIVSIVFGGIFGYYFEIFNPAIWLIIAFILSFTATLGDLFESLLKRQIGVKDSGNILPGHGGILDRFDAAVFAIPFYLLILILLS